MYKDPTGMEVDDLGIGMGLINLFKFWEMLQPIIMFVALGSLLDDMFSGFWDIFGGKNGILALMARARDRLDFLFGNSSFVFGDIDWARLFGAGIFDAFVAAILAGYDAVRNTSGEVGPFFPLIGLAFMLGFFGELIGLR